MSGTFAWVGASPHNAPTECLYDAEGRLARACDGAAWVAFDGDNVSGTVLAGGKGWTFFHGPGLDNPLMGYYRPTTGASRVFYWVTDGQGRELAVADSAGLQQDTDSNLDISGWHQAGGNANSYTFASARQANANLPSLSFFRNRVYDQNTGRWLQEDPIGLAGGLNLYQFNGNNPVAYTDPFGLDPCKGVLRCAWEFVKFQARGFLAGSDPTGTTGLPSNGGQLGYGLGKLSMGFAAAGTIGRVGGAVAGADAVADGAIVVRGGQGAIPAAGEVFSGAVGRTLEEAASGVPHGTIRATTAGEIRAGGGSVELSPELTRSGAMNERHANICLGSGSCPFGEPMPNPVPKSQRVQ
jgi:RHS repeat-associated protein